MGAGAIAAPLGAAGTLAGTLAVNKLEKVNTTDDKHTYELTTTLDENGSLKLGFGSSLSGSVDCESYGIDNIVIGLVDAEGTGQTTDQCGCIKGDINVNVNMDVTVNVEGETFSNEQHILVIEPDEEEDPSLSIGIEVNGEIEADSPSGEQPALVIEPVEEEDPSLSIGIEVNGDIEADSPSGEQPALVIEPDEEEDPSLSIGIEVKGEIVADSPSGEQPALVIEPDEEEDPTLSIGIEINDEIEADSPSEEQPALVIEPVEEEDPSQSIGIEINDEIDADAPNGEQPTLVLDPVEDEDPVLNIDIGINKDIEESALDDEEVVQGIKAEDVTTEEGTIDLDLLGEMLGIDLLSDSSEVDRETLCDLVYQHYQSMISASSTSPSGKIAASEAANDNAQSLYPTTENAAMGATSAHLSSAFEVI
ncbi:MAG: hypothetical protein ABW072_17315 [Sedimenticola sp.]